MVTIQDYIDEHTPLYTQKEVNELLLTLKEANDILFNLNQNYFCNVIQSVIVDFPVKNKG